MLGSKQGNSSSIAALQPANYGTASGGKYLIHSHCLIGEQSAFTQLWQAGINCGQACREKGRLQARSEKAKNRIFRLFNRLKKYFKPCI
jgi:hypothetical protein